MTSAPFPLAFETRAAPAWLAMLVPVLFLGCGEDDGMMTVGDGGMEDAGGDDATPTDGGADARPFETPTPIRLVGWSPLVRVEALGEPEIDFIIDTGSPVTVLDTDYYGGDPGQLDVSFAMFGSTYSVAGAVRFNVFGSPPPGATLTMAGIMGSDALLGLSLTVDYQNELAYLSSTLTGDPNVDADTTPSYAVSFELQGGGSFAIPGDGSTRIGATRVVFAGEVEGTTTFMVLDTGATHSVIDEAFLASLGGPPRPTLDGVNVGGAFGVSEAFLSRVANLDVGGAQLAGATVLSVPGWGAFDDLRSETGIDVNVLLGGTFLRYFLTTMNYGETELRLAPFTDPSHVNGREWIGPGFAVTDGPSGDFFVSDVYAGTDAAARGVQERDRLTEVDGMPTSAFDLAGYRELVTTFPVGETVTFGFREGPSIRNVAIRIDDLLPDYP